MIDITIEPPIRLTDAKRFFGPGRGNRPTHLSTIIRWIQDGVKTPTGRVRLEAIRVGSRWMTSAAAVQRFVEALTPRMDNPPASPRTSAARRRAADRAQRRNEKSGL